MQTIREQREKIYCVTLFPMTPEGKRAFYMDRSYTVIGEAPEVWGGIQMGNLVEIDYDRGSQFFSPIAPEWARDLLEKGFRYVTFWTNYYE